MLYNQIMATSYAVVTSCSKGVWGEDGDQNESD